MSQKIEVIGQKFGRLLILNYSKKTPHNHRRYLAQCNCGKKCVVSKNSLLSGHTQSCGCLQRERTQDFNKLRINEKNPAYYHGLNSQAAKKHREFIRRRDKYKCQRCDKIQENDRKLDVHHIDGNHYNDDPKNEVSLCKGCHMKVTNDKNIWRPKFIGDE